MRKLLPAQQRLLDRIEAAGNNGVRRREGQGNDPHFTRTVKVLVDRGLIQYFNIVRVHESRDGGPVTPIYSSVYFSRKVAVAALPYYCDLCQQSHYDYRGGVNASTDHIG